MSAPIEATILESRLGHSSEYLFDGDTVMVALDGGEGVVHATAGSGEHTPLRLCSEPFEPHVPVCEPSRLSVLPGINDEGEEADWHVYPAPSCSRLEFESLLTELLEIGWPAVRI